MNVHISYHRGNPQQLSALLMLDMSDTLVYLDNIDVLVNLLAILKPHHKITITFDNSINYLLKDAILDIIKKRFGS